VNQLLLSPFVLSLSKSCYSLSAIEKKERGFDKLSPNGFWGF